MLAGAANASAHTSVNERGDSSEQADAGATACVGAARRIVEPGARTRGTEAELSLLSPRRFSVRSRHIPRAVLRELFARDGEQCAFVSASGHRCDERGMLEVHHVHAFALGGESTVENLKLVCRAHNGFFADQDFGSGFMREKRASSKAGNDQSVLFGR